MRRRAGPSMSYQQAGKLLVAEVPPFSRSGECHSSHTHKTAQAHQTGFRCAGCGGDARDRRARSGNRPPFPQSRLAAVRHLVAVSPAGSQSARAPPRLRDGRRRLGGGAGRAWWLWEWLQRYLNNLIVGKIHMPKLASIKFTLLKPPSWQQLH